MVVQGASVSFEIRFKCCLLRSLPYNGLTACPCRFRYIVNKLNSKFESKLNIVLIELPYHSYCRGVQERLC